ncbi:EI24 domain-containing protein [Massilia violaceinigra]|uniref:EI24 domain-containing protein n=1 Tax=Massilia violaceinigra TaxID=2045208 RepID=A0ABY4A178_9BURK|nr:EI24 domain-containing protein [Massilia violaceinigra]UOD27464.1 EI24 domain-containing protein [Massilia violaceinigra]
MTKTPWRPVATAYRRALVSQANPRMLLLTVIPFVLSVLLWAILLAYGFQPLLDYVQALFQDHDWFKTTSATLGTFGMSAVKTMIVPLIAMLLLLPLMIATSLIFMGVAAMPPITRHVAARHYSTLEAKNEGSFMAGLAINISTSLLFVVVWIATLPLYIVPPVAVLVQVVLWGALTTRVMVYDALEDYASADEMKEIRRRHRAQLTFIGIVSGFIGALPGIVWLGGAVISFVLFPFLAAISIWLYVLIFVFTALWFQYYCMQALADLRAARKTAPDGAAAPVDAGTLPPA